MLKTNVLRILDKENIKYNSREYDDEITDAVEVAKAVNKNPEEVFKTLVTEANNHEHYVFVIPSMMTLDLKKAAKAAGVKSISLIHQKELLPLTGYIHGGCSPIGMKKVFPTTFQHEAENFDTIIFSAGKIGYQVEMPLSSLSKIIRYQTADIVIEENVNE